MRTFICLAAALGLLSCGDDTSASEERSASLFSSKVTDIVIEVDYAKGAAPYTGTESLFGADLWQLVHTNVEVLFEGSGKTITIDDSLADMDELDPTPGGPDYDADEILALADRYRDTFDTPVLRSFYVIFLDGYFTEGGVRKSSVLGVSLGTTGVIAMFKPVIAGTGLTNRRVEQTTLIHELGHAFGLVDNGLPPVDASHADHPHGAHCTNESCIMYYQNEVGASLSGFITARVNNGTSVLFDHDCLDDAKAALERGQ